MKVSILIVAFTFIFLSGLSQTVQIKQYSFSQDTIFITFDLLDTLENSYRFEFYSSIDQFKSPLKEIYGDFSQVQAGKDHHIKWAIASELKEFSGNVAIQIKGYEIPTPLQFITLPKKVKRGTSTQLSWTGGKLSNGYILKWKKNGIIINSSDIINSRNINYEIPKKLKPGNYSIELNSTVQGLPNTEASILVRRKIGLGWQVSPLGLTLIGGLIILAQPEPVPLLPKPPQPSK